MKSGAGFTLMEILISASIFGIALVIAVGLFTSVSTAQRRVQVMTKLQGDTRYLMDVVSQEIRMNGIDYRWYTNGRINGYYDILEPSGQGYAMLHWSESFDRPTYEIVTTDPSGIRRIYRKIETEYQSWKKFPGGKYFIGICTQNINDPTQDKKCTLKSIDVEQQTEERYPNYLRITPENISVDEFVVWLAPGSDPNTLPPSSQWDCNYDRISDPSLSDTSYTPTQPTSGYDESKGVCTCKSDGDCRFQSCIGALFDEINPENTILGACVNVNEQPRVTFVMTSRNVNVPENQQQTTTLQTTVSTRTYKR